MVPQADPVQPAPDRLQVTAVLVVPETVAVNCWCAPVTTLAVAGDTETLTGMIVTVAVADLLESACEVAVTLTVDGLGTVVGAVYRPELESVPQADPLHPAPDRLHVTAVLLVPVTVAVNCW
jgi:hypothetical protein